MRSLLLPSSVQLKTPKSRQPSNITFGNSIPFICIAIALINSVSCIHAASLEPQFINENERNNQPLSDEDDYPMLDSSLEDDLPSQVRSLRVINFRSILEYYSDTFVITNFNEYFQ